MIPCSPLAGPAARKISSSQIPVAGRLPGKSQVPRFQLPSDWACRLKDLKYADCSCYPAAFYWTCHQTKPKYPDCSCSLQPSYWACRLNKTQASVRGHTTACEPLSHAGKGRFVQDLFNLLRVKPKLLGLTPKKSQVVRLQLLLCSPLAGPAGTKTSSTQSALAILQLSSGPATKQSKVVRLQLLPCSPLTGPTAQKISSSQIAVATL